MPEAGGESWRRIPPAERARQFMPFAALRGYYELVEQANVQPEERRELTEERAAALDAALAGVRVGSLVRVTHYDGSAYVCTEGIVTALSVELRTLSVVKRRIGFDDIWELAALA